MLFSEEQIFLKSRCARILIHPLFYGVVRLTDALDADVVLCGEHAGTGACGRADGERERRGRPVDHAASHELQDDVAVVIDVALLDVVEETVLLERFLPEADDVVLGLAGGGGQQVGDGLEDGADGLPPFQSAS